MQIDNLISELETQRNNLPIAEENYHQWCKSNITTAFMLDLKIAQAECLQNLTGADPFSVTQIAAWQAVLEQFENLIEWLPQELIEE